jgi:hypothetical protein
MQIYVEDVFSIAPRQLFANMEKLTAPTNGMHWFKFSGASNRFLPQMDAHLALCLYL